MFNLQIVEQETDRIQLRISIPDFHAFILRVVDIIDHVPVLVQNIDVPKK
jgi:hypothetical protein